MADCPLLLTAQDRAPELEDSEIDAALAQLTAAFVQSQPQSAKGPYPTFKARLNHFTGPARESVE
jgi:hypothetical protein